MGVLALLAGLAYLDLTITHILRAGEWWDGLPYAVIAASHFLGHRVNKRQ
jgi:hypothetical protein